ncbi:MAG TPA: hypothetical protein VNW71_12755 [Thermoanaerobaculia bacterium]|nr:hypothetical protein [Thermoanaerobaculia bacterium]
MNERSLWWLLALLILTGAVSGLVFNQPRTLYPKLARELPAPRPQAAKARQFRPAPIEAAGLVPAGPGHKLGRPGLLEVTAEGFAYVFDYRDMQLKGVSPEGAVVPVTGADVALANPTDLVRDRDGRLWLCDPKAGPAPGSGAGRPPRPVLHSCQAGDEPGGFFGRPHFCVDPHR